MRVLNINAVSGLSSTGRICTEIANYLNHNKHEGFIAYSSGIPYYKGYKIGTSVDVKKHGLSSRLFGTQAYFSKGSTRKLLKYVSELKPDVVHLHNLHSNFINLKLLLNYLAVNDIPTVITLHDCWFYTGKCTHYTVDMCYKWQTSCGVCPRLRKDNPSWFFDRTSKMVQDKREWFSKIPRLAVVGVSDWITKEAEKSFLSSAQIVTRIYNWIDLEAFRPINAKVLRQKMKLDDEFVILSVASEWSNAKGFDSLCELANIIPEEMKIVIVGKIDSKFKVPNKIMQIPQTHNVSELAQYYSMADVYLHLSQEETFGKTIAEALSCGTPAVVLNSTACPEIVDESCGIVVKDNQPHTILNAIEKIQKNGKHFYTESSVERVRELFNANTNMSELLKLYQKLISYYVD